MRVPSPRQMVKVAFWKTCVVKDHSSSGTLCFQFDADDRVDAGIPMRRTPRLHDSLVGDQFDASPFNLSAKGSESSARFRVDLGRHAGEGSELLRVQENLIDALRARLEINLLVKRRAHLVCRCARRFLHGLLPGCAPDFWTRN